MRGLTTAHGTQTDERRPGAHRHGDPCHSAAEADTAPETPNGQSQTLDSKNRVSQLATQDEKITPQSRWSAPLRYASVKFRVTAGSTGMPGPVVVETVTFLR